MQTLFYQPGISSGLNYLTPDESRHCLKVLRKKSGDIIYITDGQGSVFEATVTKAQPEQCAFRVQHTTRYPARSYSFNLGIAPTKNTDRMEWLAEKCIEIGVNRISFIQTTHSERTSLNTARLQKIAISAMKQSLYPYLPVIEPICPYPGYLAAVTDDQKFIAHGGPGHAHLADVAKPGGTCTVLVGPEGDFTADELHQAGLSGFKPVSLGTSRLRTETAGLSACLILSLINRHFRQNPTSP